MTRIGRPNVTAHEFNTWYDWALVWRYWNQDAAGLRMPYRREQQALIRLAAVHGLTTLQTAERLGIPERTIVRWRAAS